ncbi:MAG: toprim domain-containing protein [Proteobacteria bacterium]|nr:toprim domain-containing protein [Pseudomonadota bacterium]
MIPKHLDFAYLKRRVSICAVLNAKGVNAPLRRQGDRLVGPCPVHGGDNPNAFVISLSKNLWHCFTRCDSGGDVVKFARRLYGISYRQTASLLASLAGAPNEPSIETRRFAKKVFRPFNRQLNLDPSSSYLGKKGITRKTALHFEAGAYYGPGFLNRCIGVRLHDIHGLPLGYAGRRLDADELEKYGKWKFPPDFPKNEILFNFHRVRRYIQKHLVIVEGPWDVMRLTQLAIPSVALLGVHLSSAHVDLLSNVPHVILMLDGDRSGRRAAKQIKRRLASYAPTSLINLPMSLDPADLTDAELTFYYKKL